MTTHIALVSGICTYHTLSKCIAMYDGVPFLFAG